MNSTQNKKPNNHRMILEYGPLILFFVVNLFYGIFISTAVLVITSIAALAISWMRDRHIPKMLAFGCIAVTFFGLLTLIFNDETFIKIKPTVIGLIIASALFIGVILGRNPLKYIIGEQMKVALNDKAWRQITWLWIAMFITIALANEWAWRNLTTNQWVTFKTFGLTGISMGFAIAITVVMAKQNNK